MVVDSGWSETSDALDKEIWGGLCGWGRGRLTDGELGDKRGEEGRVDAETKETGRLGVRDGREGGQDGDMDDGGRLGFRYGSRAKDGGSIKGKGEPGRNGSSGRTVGLKMGGSKLEERRSSRFVEDGVVMDER